MPWITSKEHIDAEVERRLKGQTIGQRIRFIRGGRSREELAKRYEISVSQLKRYELGKGRPPDDFLRKFYHREGLSYSWLEYGDGPVYHFQAQAAARSTPPKQELMALADEVSIGVSDDVS